MFYRIIFTIGYCETYFDFQNVDDALVLAKQMLEHNRVTNEYNKTYLRIEVIFDEEPGADNGRDQGGSPDQTEQEGQI